MKLTLLLPTLSTLGTVCPSAGFPTLGILRMQNVATDFFKINVFGSESRYRSIILEVEVSGEIVLANNW